MLKFLFIKLEINIKLTLSKINKTSFENSPKFRLELDQI